METENAKSMTDSAKEARRQYMKEYTKTWRKTHKDKIREYNIRYWTNRAAREAVTDK